MLTVPREKGKKMARLIDADKLESGEVVIPKIYVKEGNLEVSYEYVEVFYKDDVDNAPTVEPKHGRWIRNDNGTYSCSECKSWIPNEQYYYARYCLFCGAKMNEVPDETD